MFCVAMPAWSVPGSQSASRPFMRAQRTSTSWTVLFSPCPTCRMAVTLGGGMTSVYGSRSSRSEDGVADPRDRRTRDASAVKQPAWSQRA
jgi:hypothetical protein